MLNKGENRIGTCILQANGQNAVCVTYNSSTNIVVKLDNGNLIPTTWKTFSKGLLKATEDTRSRVGQKKMQNCGKMITCIAYRTATDCDFQFDDGKIMPHRRWDEFSRGAIAYVLKTDALEKNKKERVGVTIRQRSGLNLTCIAYRKTSDCDFQFDDGEIVTHRQWSAFTSGTISRTNPKEQKELRIGKRTRQTNGHTAECIAYRNSHDCDFRYEDGKEVQHMQWTAFIHGDLPYLTRKETAGTRVGQKKMQSCGKNITCIAYRGTNDCDFQFDDGKVLEHRSWTEFVRGALRYYSRDVLPSVRVGTAFIQSCGLSAVCIAYRGATDIDVSFPDGMIVAHRTWNGFKKGTINHPLFTSKTGSRDFYGHNVNKAFTDANGNVYYRCVDNKTGKKSIHTLLELIQPVMK